MDPDLQADPNGSQAYAQYQQMGTPPAGIDTSDLSGSVPNYGGGAPSPPISGNNLDPQLSQAAGIQDDYANPVAGQGNVGVAEPQPQRPTPYGLNQPDNNAIQAGSQVAGKFISDTFGQQGPIPNTGQPEENGRNPQGSPKKLASLVLGAEAAPPQVLDQVKSAVDPRNTQPPGNQNLMAVDAAFQHGGMKEAFPLLQANRVAFNAKQAFAYTALNGIDGKSADINAAVDAANQAEQHVLDGSNVKFAHSDAGKITATVTMAGTDKAQTIPLTTDQFKQFLNVGVNHWDRLMSQTVPATLQQISSGRSMIVNAGKPAPTPTKGDDNNEEAEQNNVRPALSTPGAKDVTQGDQPARPGQFDTQGHFIGRAPKSYSDQQAEADQNNYGVELEKRSRSIYPDVGHEAERQQWMAAQEEKDLARQNMIDVASEKGKNEIEKAKMTGFYRNQAADTSGQHRENAAKIKADNLANYQAARLADDRAKRTGINAGNADRNLTAYWNNRQQNSTINPLTPEETAQRDADFARIRGRSTSIRQAPAVPTGKPAPPPTGQANAAPDIHQQAIQWAQAHPNDPRAARIMQQNGM